MLKGDSQELKRLQTLFPANATDEEFTSAQDEMDALLRPELSFALEDW